MHTLITKTTKNIIKGCMVEILKVPNKIKETFSTGLHSKKNYIHCVVSINVATTKPAFCATCTTCHNLFIVINEFRIKSSITIFTGS